MRTDRNILLAFILNILFSIFEFVGGIFTNSVAIMSDAIHDFGDAVSIGVAYFLERISKRKPDNNYTYGYVRYSVLGAILTNVILVIGSVLVLISSVGRLFDPVVVNYDGMIVLAIFGVVINFLAVYFTKGGKSLNQKAVSLHMLEDVLGWVIVLIGAFVIKFSGMYSLDAILSIIVAMFILINALKGFKEIVDLFLEKVPKGLCVEDIREHLLCIKGVKDVHHIHIWSIDGINNFATMHIISDCKNVYMLKKKVKEELMFYNINHSTIEMESSDYECKDFDCHIDNKEVVRHHHH